MKAIEKKAAEDESFETGMSELERIVGNLEGGELPLEAALAAFEEGVKIAQRLTRRLNEAESRVEVLSRNASGENELSAFQSDAKDE